MSFGLNEIQVTKTKKGNIISVWIMGRYCHTEFSKTDCDVKYYLCHGYTIRPEIRKD